MTRDAQIDKIVKLLRELILSYTIHGDHLITEAEPRTMGLTINIKAHGEDHGKIIGKLGQHITALKTIFDFIGRSYGIKIRLMILDPTVGERPAPGTLPPFQANPKWNSKKVLHLLGLILDMVLKEPYKIDAIGSVETTIEIMPHKLERLKLIHPEYNDRNDFGLALEDLFHAIGKSEGRIIHVDVIDPQVYANKAA